MYMRIDQAGQNELVPGVIYLSGLIGIYLGLNPVNFVCCQADVKPALALVGGVYQMAVFYQQIEFFHFMCSFGYYHYIIFS